jgi:uncharacterized RDD family membrane protein YckC
MKCPKCGYLGVEPADRCRNCGYDGSLEQATTFPELEIRTDSPKLGPLDDLSFTNAAAPVDTPRAPKEPVPNLDRVFGEAESARSTLPLFRRLIPDDEPLITIPSPPRPPLSVRRSTPEVARIRAALPRTQALDLVLDGDASGRLDSPPMSDLRPQRDDGPAPMPLATAEDAAVGSRLAAVVIDVIILAVIDALVIYFTMQICGLGINELDILPKWPLLAFLLVQNGGYLVAFTAGGQTLGKMAVGIKVVPDHSHSSVDLRQAFARELMWLVLAVPAGLGFLTIFSPGRRGLHDRFAGTRVVR